MMDTQEVAFGSENLPLKIGAIELPCFILHDKSVVFSKIGFQKALGYDGKSENWLFDFLSSINKFYPVPGDLFEAFESPIRFEMERNDGSYAILDGLYPEIVYLSSLTIINAKNDGYLSVNQLKHAKAAAVIERFFDQNNVIEAVAEATGLNFTKETGKAFLQNYILQHNNDLMYQWTSVLRDDFWEKIFEIHAMDWTDLRENPKKVADILQEIVFSRLSDHLTDIVRNQKPKRTYKRKGNKTQDNEHPELKAYISEILSLMKAAADNWTIFLQLLNRIYPKNNNADLEFPESRTAVESTGSLDAHLRKAIAVNKIYHKAK